MSKYIAQTKKQIVGKKLNKKKINLIRGNIIITEYFNKTGYDKG